MAEYTNYKINPYQTINRFRRVSSANTNSLSISAVPSNLIAITLQNNSAAVKYVKLYNKATAPTVGTDIPHITYNVPAGQTWTHNYDCGLAFPLGIGLSINAGFADTDNVGVAVDDIHLVAVYA